MNIPPPRPSDPRFGVGPSLIPPEFVNGLANIHQSFLGMSHRKPQVIEMIEKIQADLRSYLDIPRDYQILLGNGGASFLFDALGLNLIKKKALHFVLGEFSDKWYQAHSAIPEVKVDILKASYGEQVSPCQAAKIIKENSYDTICCTLNETSTGVMLSPDTFDQINDSRPLWLMDATSGAGQIPIPFDKMDAVFFSPQKVFASEGGTFILILSPRAIQRLQQVSRYIPRFMNLNAHLKEATNHQTLNTPSLTTLYFLKCSADYLKNIGFEKIYQKSQIRAQKVYAFAESKPYLSPFVKDEKVRSLSTPVINLVGDIDTIKLHQFFAAEKIAFDIEGYRKLGLNQLRFSLFPLVSDQDIDYLLQWIAYYFEVIH